MNRKTILAILAAMCVILVGGCIVQYVLKDSGRQAARQIFAMDTVMQFTAYGRKSEEAVDAAVSEVLKLDAMLSTGNASSEISKLNKDGSAEVSDETLSIINRSLEIYYDTGGLFDMTVYPVMCLWGFPTQEYHVPTEAELKETLSLVGSSSVQVEGNRVTLGENQQIDLGGIAKGYTSARIMEIFSGYGIKSAMVSLGGNIQTLGKKTDGTLWRIGIRDPDTSSDSIGILAVITVRDRAVITSGGYERYFEEDGKTYIHIIDPRTGCPAESGLSSVTIVSEDGMLADALSTSLYIMGAERAEEYWRERCDEFDMVLITDEGGIIITEGIENDVETDIGLTVLRSE